MQIALLFPERVAVKAIISVCAPLNDVSSGTAVPRGHRRILGCWPPPPRQAEAVIREYIRSIKPGAVRSEGDPVDMWPMLLSMAREYYVSCVRVRVECRRRKHGTSSPIISCLIACHWKCANILLTA